MTDEYIKKQDALHFMNVQREQIKKKMDEALAYEHFHTRSDLKCALSQLEDDIFLLESMSAADVRPVVRGGWIYKHRHIGGFRVVTGEDEYGNQHTIRIDERYEIDEPYCSECGKLNEAYSLNFCPNCGADMRETEPQKCEDCRHGAHWDSVVICDRDGQRHERDGRCNHGG